MEKSPEIWSSIIFLLLRILFWAEQYIANGLQQYRYHLLGLLPLGVSLSICGFTVFTTFTVYSIIHYLSFTQQRLLIGEIYHTRAVISAYAEKIFETLLLRSIALKLQTWLLSFEYLLISRRWDQRNKSHLGVRIEWDFEVIVAKTNTWVLSACERALTTSSSRFLGSWDGFQW